MEGTQAFLRGQPMEIKKRTAGNWLAWLNLVGFLLMVAVNYLANALPLNHLTTGELSDKYPNLFVPAGFTFSIWGVIYILLAIFVFFSLKQGISGQEVFPAFKKVGLLFSLTCLANASWIFAWHFQKLILSLLIMILLLILLIIIYQRLDQRPNQEKRKDKFPAKLPFSIYLAWISVATVANATAVLVGLGWNGFGLSPQFWTVGVLALILILTLIFILKKKDLLYGLTVCWALFGIYYKRIHDTAADRVVEIAALAGLALILLALVLRVIVRPRKSSLT
ncbi:MAG: hypothetical protein ACPLZD_00650 [Candidatus Saccharicenans sp.]